MASLRDIRSRISSVQSTQQVTRAMKMVAAAKLRKSQERIFATRPYAYQISEIIAHLNHRFDTTAHPLFTPYETVERPVIVVVTADRGLAGGFNANIIRTAEDLIRREYASFYPNGGGKLICIGRKAHEHFSRRGYELIGDFRGQMDDLQLSLATTVAKQLSEAFLSGDAHVVHLVYNEFKNTITQNRIVEPLFPIPLERFMTPVMERELDGQERIDPDRGIDYIFEPSGPALIDALVPRYVTYQLWRVLLESNAAEQGARMMAMDNATTNAGELIKSLRLQYNRARQDAITTEIIEITSGANALESA